MRVNRERPYRSLTVTKMLLVAVAIAILGVVLLCVGQLGSPWWTSLQAVIRDVGALLVVSAALGVIWDLIGKRAFTLEILEAARTSTDVEAAGLTRIGTNYAEEPDWEALFSGVRKIDIFVAYGSTWRNTHHERLEKAAASGARIRVYLPDPQDTAMIGQLAGRFGKTPQELVILIDQARTAYQSLPVAKKGSVEVFYRPGDPVFSCYRFDSTAVLTLYTHQGVRTGVPTVVCRDGGSLYEFIRGEFKAFGVQSRLATPTAARLKPPTVAPVTSPNRPLPGSTA